MEGGAGWIGGDIYSAKNTLLGGNYGLRNGGGGGLWGVALRGPRSKATTNAKDVMV